MNVMNGQQPHPVCFVIDTSANMNIQTTYSISCLDLVKGMVENFVVDKNPESTRVERSKGAFVFGLVTCDEYNPTKVRSLFILLCFLTLLFVGVLLFT